MAKYRSNYSILSGGGSGEKAEEHVHLGYSPNIPKSMLKLLAKLSVIENDNLSFLITSKGTYACYKHNRKR